MCKKKNMAILLIMLLLQSLWSFNYEKETSKPTTSKSNNRDFYAFVFKPEFSGLYPELYLAWEEVNNLHYCSRNLDPLDGNPNHHWTVSYINGRVSEINENTSLDDPSYSSVKTQFYYSEEPDITIPVQILVSRFINTEWTPYYRVTLTSNSDNRVLSTTEEIFSYNVWLGSLQFFYTYDDNHVVSVIRKYYDEITQNWALAVSATLDWENDQLNEILYKNWVDNSWVNSQFRTFEYVSGDTLSCSFIDHLWRDDHWRNDWKVTTETYENKLISRFDFEAMAPDFTYFVNKRREFFSYNDFGQLSEHIAWLNYQNDWLNIGLFTYSYLPTHNEESLVICDTWLNAYPNPFNPTTTIKYKVKSSTDLLIQIFNVKGQLVKTLYNKNQKKGIFSIIWDGRDQYNSSVSSGTYFVLMKTKEGAQMRKVMLLK